MTSPKILAPAGNRQSFLAAIAAGADAVYCGLKLFSARMEADNFSIDELSRLSRLARLYNVTVHVAFNAIIKENEQEKVFNILKKTCAYVDVDGLILQDLSLIPLARKAGFNKAFHLSTLANCTFPKAVHAAEKFGLDTIVLPREFTIDEIKAMAKKTPERIRLEIFVHGALCYSISGRCYWSSYFGGKSALRGRCVQPCRRVYEQKGQKNRFFSCLDFSSDVLAKALKQIPEIITWKIEGRKKSAHYVYYTVKAYRLFRDHPHRKKEALAFLDYAMGREFTHYHLLTQRKINPLNHSSETGSGLFTGRVKNPVSPYFQTRVPIFPDDLLRIGFEDDAYHDIQRATRAVPEKGKYYLKKQSEYRIKKGTPVYIIDRRTDELKSAIQRIEDVLRDIEKVDARPLKHMAIPKSLAGMAHRPSRKSIDIIVNRSHSRQKQRQTGVWISEGSCAVSLNKTHWICIDPILFPSEETICRASIQRALKKGSKNFILNAPWQISLFKHPDQLNLWAGPFCNITNATAIHMLKENGFSGVFVSPELDKENFAALPSRSSLPLGIVIYGNWPLGISRIISDTLRANQPFYSPKGEVAWYAKHNRNYYVYPNWLLDLSSKKEQLIQWGYSHFLTLREPIPGRVQIKKRQGLWNWNLKLL